MDVPLPKFGRSTRFFFYKKPVYKNLSENPAPKELSTSTIVLGSKVRKKLFRKKPRFGKILHRIFYFHYMKISKSVRNLTNSKTVKKLLRNFDTKKRAFLRNWRLEIFSKFLIKKKRVADLEIRLRAGRQ